MGQQDPAVDRHAQWDEAAGHIRALARLMLEGPVPADVEDCQSHNELGLALESLNVHVKESLS